MSFTGDLEHLPIVDVIQLLHSTRKSGTLLVRGRKGESQLVFRDGYIVSANHPNNSIRIGRLLAESGAITHDALEQALARQQQSDGPRQPLVAILLESGALDQEAAYRGLTALIEITIVEMLRNVRGTFCLDVDRFDVSDEYRYFPEHLQQELSLNTQMVLMDALRLFDERNRDGLEEQPFFPEDPTSPGAKEAGENPTLSADDLGLGDLDLLGRNIPEVFAPIEDVDPAQHHRQQLAEILTAMPETGLEEFVEFLTTLPPPQAQAAAAVEPSRRILICFSPDLLLRHGVVTLAQHIGLPVFATSEEPDLGPLLDQFLVRGEQPVLLLDTPQETSESPLQRLRQDHGPLPVLQLVAPGDFRQPLQALRQGATLLLPRPERHPGNIELGEQMIATLELLRVALGSPCLGQNSSPLRGWADFHATLRCCQDPADISYALLQAVAEHFPRALTLVVGRGELILERGIGLGPQAPAPRLRLPLAADSLAAEVVAQGTCHWGLLPPQALPSMLMAEVGSPRCDTGLLLPLQLRGRTVALVYADFGQEEVAAVPMELLQALAQHAGLALENAFYRKQLDKPA